ncbi:putative protein-disulfide isomerase [Chitinophaga skermanii]|uniref:DSBA-like thioredoxin domain-containing protein n=1 Tax=Chitinophaga skermanii TaxID=331697 RepID=A0A327QK47_9BACT|nr:DsbA family protein [Chitinophaga skermanii]RAJ05006.1 putative protein-disulfide isomerase [Chitinophaga skermanii]
MELIYVYDALCGWCYGFTPVMQAFQRKHTDIACSVMSGGMMSNTPASKMASYIQQAYHSVEQTTGIKFGQGFLQGILESPTYIMDSEKPAIALSAFKMLAPGSAIDFAHDIQVAFNYDGKDLHADETYSNLVHKYGVREDDYLAALHSEDAKNAALTEFKQVQEWGITGFPAVILVTSKQLYLIARGFTHLENLENVIAKITADEGGN